MRTCAAWVLLFALLAVGSPADAGESTSANYRLKQNTVNNGGEPVSSASFRLDASAAQEATVGTSSSPAYVLQSGFWSFVGSGLVPVLLTVDQNAVMPDNVDLSWSGDNAPYTIFESTDCGNVYASTLDTTFANAYNDVASPVANLVCYNVLATAPGPAQPPN